MPSIKNQIRSLQRFLKREGLEERVRISTQKKIEVLEKRRKEISDKSVIKKNVKSHKRPRFFDRRRLVRLLKEPKDLGSNEKYLERDLIYCSYFPPHEKYITLFNRNKEKDVKVDKFGRFTDRGKELKRLQKAAWKRFEEGVKNVDEEGHIGIHSFELPIVLRLAKKYLNYSPQEPKGRKKKRKAEDVSISNDGEEEEDEEEEEQDEFFLSRNEHKKQRK